MGGRARRLCICRLRHIWGLRCWLPNISSARVLWALPALTAPSLRRRPQRHQTMRSLRLAASRISSRRLSTAVPPPASSTRRLALSIVEGPSEPPLISKTLPAYFREDILQVYGERPALISPQEHPRPHGGPPSRLIGDARYLRWDFAEFDRHIQALARGLLGLGVKKGDRVGVIMGNNRCAETQWEGKLRRK